MCVRFVPPPRYVRRKGERCTWMLKLENESWDGCLNIFRSNVTEFTQGPEFVGQQN